jgi:hypothetical protein
MEAGDFTKGDFDSHICLEYDGILVWKVSYKEECLYSIVSNEDRFPGSERRLSLMEYLAVQVCNREDFWSTTPA